ncbi:MAG TPA: helical backbone metal receptor [Gemmatimonadaceae bacterium]|nr:helical backbone metal receptor [Gemmatimonadaceae bacterium]
MYHHCSRLGFGARVAFAAALVVACGDARSRTPAVADTAAAKAIGALTLRDDFGDTLTLRAPPRRIVSLNPATTELFFALGAGDRLVGRTHFDLYPTAAQAVQDLGSAIPPNVESVLGVRPDLVLLYASESNREPAARFHAAGVPTLTLRIDHIADFRRAVGIVGRVVGDTARATVVADSVTQTLERVRAATQGKPRLTAFWKAWDSPVIAIGGGSFLSELVDIAGGKNVYGDDPRPAFDVTIEDVVRRDPDVVFAGPESGERMRAAPAWRALRAVREGRILIVDTMLVGRPGVRLGEAAVSLARLLRPGSLP